MSLGVSFGTSGVRGLATDLTSELSYAFCRSFLKHVRDHLKSKPTGLLLAGDRRESTPRIASAIARAAHDEGIPVQSLGLAPTPELAFACASQNLPGIMVTGSHIPEDRNGIKFFYPWGEILKADETPILLGAQELLPSAPSNRIAENWEKLSRAKSGFLERYLNYFAHDALRGLRIALFEHSSVAANILELSLRGLGAEVIRYGRSEAFVAVDTEAVANLESMATFVRGNKCDALVSTDGDGDRPLLIDERGTFVRGDEIGMLVTRLLKANVVVTPVSTLSSLEDSLGKNARVVRTRIGSPFVVEAMSEASRHMPQARVVGFEANGGFLLGSPIPGARGLMTALATRDSIFPLLACLAETNARGLSLSALRKELPARVGLSGLVKPVPAEIGTQITQTLGADSINELSFRFQSLGLGKLVARDLTDGVRLTFSEKSILHFRSSGNAPEFRIYVEADKVETATFLVKQGELWIRGQCDSIVLPLNAPSGHRKS